MRIVDIIHLLKEYILLGGIVLLLAGTAFFIGYKVIYQKIMKGEKRITKRKMALYGITILYLAIVFGAVFLNRASIYNTPNLHLFSSYWEAYHNMKPSLVRNIILNILLFVPFGFLLPHYSDKFKKAYTTIFIGFCVSVSIELLQYITKIGILELDDILNNTIGVWIGYGLYKTIYVLKHKEKRSYLLVYLLPIFLCGITYASIWGIYQAKEFGNLDIEANYRLAVKQAKIETEIELEQNPTIQPIYYAKTLTEAETRQKAEDLFAKLGTKIKEEDTDLYESTAIYYSENRAYSVWVEYQGGRYTFTDFTGFGKDQKPSFQAGSTREEVEQALAKPGISIPSQAEFREEQRQYVFSVTRQEIEGSVIDGNIWVTYNDDGSISKMNHNLITYEPVTEKEIRSLADAFAEIQKGNFQWWKKDKIQSIIVQAVELKYRLDTKGYYVPYYEFSAKINEEEAKIAIPALR